MEGVWPFDPIAPSPSAAKASSVLRFVSHSGFPQLTAGSSQESPPRKTRIEGNIYSDLRHIPRLRIFWAEDAGVFCSIYS